MQQTRQGVMSMKEKTQALQPASDGTALNVTQVNYCGIYVKVKKLRTQSTPTRRESSQSPPEEVTIT